jgi:hypothetical protein
LALRKPDDHKWRLLEPNAELWHAIIDEFGLPAWLRSYEVATDQSNSDPTVFCIGDRIRLLLGDQFLPIMTVSDPNHEPPMWHCHVLGYMPADFTRYSLVREPPFEIHGERDLTHFPGEWATIVPTPKTLLL